MAAACCATGPGYASPLEAFTKGERENLAYVPATVAGHTRPDRLLTIDLDPASPTYSTVVHRLEMPHLGDELHHSGWNSCSSCHGVVGSARRDKLILPALASSRVYGIDVGSEPKAPRIWRTVEPGQMPGGRSWPHTSHCLGDGSIMISTMGDARGEATGNFLLLDQELHLKGTWASSDVPFGYDFWYQPRHNTMVTSGWGAPNSFSKAFDPADVASGRYADSLYVWDWNKRVVKQTLKLGAEGLIPLETRFLHDPQATQGFVGAALSSNVLRFFRTGDATDTDAPWSTQVAIRQPHTPVAGWTALPGRPGPPGLGYLLAWAGRPGLRGWAASAALRGLGWLGWASLPEMPPLVTDILISLDDRYLYLSNWLRGDVCQYDIRDPSAPKLVGQIFLGGSICEGSGVKVTAGEFKGRQPAARVVKGRTLHGGPQMLQLSLDGTRLYVTSSLFSAWDQQFYPQMVSQGSWMVLLNVDTRRGGLHLDDRFFVDFGAEPGGPVLAHEVRFPGGDSTSDIWV